MTHQLTGINLEKAKDMAHAALDQTVVFTEFEGMIKTIAPVTMNLNAAEIEAAVEAV